ncbi:hypothetical protein HDK90DRAFT_509620 [Phyllosticta capitalensis]|uniref:Uncharacterized protein n=2 Tax=Phyllosticta capitalensis TaxID=121624 RepID=A0ABR1YTS8_9PEZI
MSTTTVTSAAIVGIVVVAAIIVGLLCLHFWRKRVERLQAKELPAPEPQPIGPPLSPQVAQAPQAAAAAAIPPPQAPQHPQHQRHASSPPQMDGMPRVPVPTPMYIQAARRSRSTHLVSIPPLPGQAVSTDAASPVTPVSPASSTSFPAFYPAARPSSIPLPDSTRTSLYLSEKDAEAGIVQQEPGNESRRSGSTDGGVRGFIRRMASTKKTESRVDEEAATEKANDMVEHEYH